MNYDAVEKFYGCNESTYAELYGINQLVVQTFADGDEGNLDSTNIVPMGRLRKSPLVCFV
jgi:hypothetical protein